MLIKVKKNVPDEEGHLTWRARSLRRMSQIRRDIQLGRPGV
jgi:hypothetical protein